MSVRPPGTPVQRLACYINLLLCIRKSLVSFRQFEGHETPRAPSTEWARTARCSDWASWCRPSEAEGHEVGPIAEAQREPWVRQENPHALEAVWKFSSVEEKVIECWILFKVFIWGGWLHLAIWRSLVTLIKSVLVKQCRQKSSWREFKRNGRPDILDRVSCIWDGWMASPTQQAWVRKIREIMMNREVWRAAVLGVRKSWTQLSHWTTTKTQCIRGSDSEESVSNARDPGSIPRSGRSPGQGNGYPLKYSCLENSMDIGAWWATVHRVTWLFQRGV